VPDANQKKKNDNFISTGDFFKINEPHRAHSSHSRKHIPRGAIARLSIPEKSIRHSQKQCGPFHPSFCLSGLPEHFSASSPSPFGHFASLGHKTKKRNRHTHVSSSGNMQAKFRKSLGKV
jgi:hypothetical protein